MPYKTFMIPHFIDEPLSSLNPFIKLARDMNAHLNIIVFGLLRPAPVTPYGSIPDDYWMMDYDGVFKQADERVNAIEAILQKEQISASVVADCQEMSMLPSTTSRHSLYADLTAMTHSEIMQKEVSTQSFNGALFNTGRPVLILNESEGFTPTPDPVVFAWDGSAEAAKAIRHAMPLLENVKDAHVVVIDPTKDMGPNPGHNIAAYITRYGLNVTVHTIPSGGKPISTVLMERVTDLNAKFLVMGAYGHSRLQEWLLGGTTRTMLTEAHVPILMAH